MTGACVLVFKGDYGTATLTETPGRVDVVLHASDGREITAHYAGTGHLGADFGVRVAASAVGHGVDADLCMDGPMEVCSHITVTGG